MVKYTLILTLLISTVSSAQKSFSNELIFPLQQQHVHSSSIVELPGGDLLVCWFQGSGERKANDVVVNGARLKKGETEWSKPFLMADTPGQPDCNPMMFLNREGKLFLVWIVVQANRWETSILKVRTTKDYAGNGAPKWQWQDVILLKPGDEFADRVKEQFTKYTKDNLAWAEYAYPYEDLLIEAAKDPKKRETGWMTRTHPVILEDGKILLPLYSDGFNFGLIAISEDGGTTWKPSLPIIGRGLNQPSLVVRNDGTIDAYMRDDGDEPGRIMMSHSTDEGYSWSYGQKSDIPNPGASIEVVKLKSGNWLMVYNDVDDGRYSLAASFSDDEGKTWRWKMNLEKSEGASFSYPSVIQAKDGKIHVTYSYFTKEGNKSIKHISFKKKQKAGKYFPQPKNGDTYVVAHRGAHRGIPENTLAAYQKAIDLGCDFVEIDLRKTKDGRFVSVHNSTVDAYTQGKVKGKVGDFTLAELKELNIGKRVGSEWVNERIPAFEEILQLCKGKIGIYLDLKEPDVKAQIDIIKEYGMERNIIWYIPASHSEVINEVKRNCNNCIVMPDPGSKENIPAVAKEFNPTVIATDMGELNEDYMKLAKQYNIKVIVDEKRGTEKEWNKILKMGTDGIQTDNPERLIGYLRNRQK